MNIENSLNQPFEAVEFVDEIPASYRQPFIRGSVAWPERIVEQLRQQPGRWAIVRRGVSNTHLAAYGTFLRKAGAETITRRVNPQETFLFARIPA